MPIELGLARIARLLEHTRLPWKAIHVAGTNGKGSICAYASAMLQAANVRCGRFTSPHLVDRWDCITVDGKVVKESLFREVEDHVKRRDAKHGIGAFEFEILTATAFEIFNREKVDVGVVEVGLGGRLDATNIIQNAIVTVISKIGLDHQSLLGGTTEEIAYQKAGIMRTNVPCVIDASNSAHVLEVLDKYGAEIGAGPLIKVPVLDPPNAQVQNHLHNHQLESHQQANLNCAFEAVKIALGQLNLHIDPIKLLRAAATTSWPGRLQHLSISSLTARKGPILIDGAHNPQSAAVLGSYVDRHLRPTGRNVTWVLAATDGKDLQGLFLPLLRPGDQVVATEFGPVDGMPWVQPSKSLVVADTVRHMTDLDHLCDAGSDVVAALREADHAAGEGPLVVAGSLYLVSHVLRLLRDADPGA